MGVGFGIGMKFRSGKGTVLKPLLARQFLSRDDNQLIDNIDDRDALVKWPVSYYNGISSITKIGFNNTPTPNTINVHISYIINSTPSANLFLIDFGSAGANTPGFRVQINQANRLTMSVTSGAAFETSGFIQLNTNILNELSINLNSNGDYTINNNGTILTGTFSIMPSSICPNNIFTIASSTLGVGNIDIDVISFEYYDSDNRNYNIPLPHLGIGFVSDGAGGWNTIELDNTDVGEDYYMQGSKYMQYRGALDRLTFNRDDSFQQDAWTPAGEFFIIPNGIAINVDGSIGNLSSCFSDVIIPNISYFIAEYSIDINVIRNSDLDISTISITGLTGILDPYEVVNNQLRYREMISNTTPTSNRRLVIQGFRFNNKDAYIEFTNFKASFRSIYPNNPLGEPAFTLIPNDILIGASSFLNISPFMLTLFTIGDTDIEYAFFDKRDRTIWKSSIEDEDYDISNPGDWRQRQLNPVYINNNIQDAYRYQFWIHLVSELMQTEETQYKEIALLEEPAAVPSRINQLKGKYNSRKIEIPFDNTIPFNDDIPIE